MTETTMRVRAITTAVFAAILVSGCASQSAPEMSLAPQGGSLNELKAAALQETIEQCLNDATRAYPNVQSYVIWDACQAAAGRPQMTQRINRF
jgi:hypothetical protein